MQRGILIVIAALGLTLGACDDGYDNDMDYEDDGAATATGEAGAMDEDATESTETAVYGDDTAEDARDAEELVQEAATVVDNLKADPEISQALSQAKAILIAPDYGKGALGVGVRGGEGVLVARTAQGWSGPAFYDIGAISFGPQIGGTAGDVALLIMSENALDNFTEDQNFSFNADAGFTMLDFSAHGQQSWGKGEDVIFWSDTEGAFIGASLSATDIDWDDEENPAYYGQSVDPERILNGLLTTDKGRMLTEALPS